MASGISSLLSLTSSDMERVDTLLASRASSDVNLISEISRHIIDSGGKRLRPMLTLAASKLCDYTGDHHITLAAGVEFMHTATLLHDDVVDESDRRRGKDTARILWSNQASVLVGDFLLGQAFAMMVESGSMEALRVLSSSARVIAKGEVKQLSVLGSLDITREDYLDIISSKTASLFSACAQMGPILSECPNEIQSQFESYGLNLGLAFQLVDDALDYGGETTNLGKNIGDDFHEHKVTLPVLLSYWNGDSTTKSFWQDCFSNRALTDTDLQNARDQLNSDGSLEATLNCAKEYGDAASNALATLPNSDAKDALLSVVSYCIARGT